MNCKPGDLARLVNLPKSLSKANDRFVKLKNQPPVMIDGELGWELEERVKFTMTGNATRNGVLFREGDAVYFDVMQDRNLRPIRDPGDDAVDEMVAKLGRPASYPDRVPA